MENIQVVQHTTQELFNQAQSRILDLKGYLAETDYLENKDRSGCDMTAYGNWKELRNDARQAIDTEESEVLRLRELLIHEAEETLTSGTI